MMLPIGFFMLDMHHLIYVALPALALGLITQIWVKAAYAKWKKVGNSQGISGAEAAKVILRAAGVQDVRVEEVSGFLSDHYSPSEKVLRLSPENYSGTSIAAVGIAAHEAGHAIQHAVRYAPVVIRTLAVPMASVGSSFGYIAIVIGLMMSSGNPSNPLTLIGLAGIAAVALFQLVNLPVEFDASRRALALLPQIGILDLEETEGARKVLTAAAMTYVAATVAALLELFYWLIRLGIIGGGSNNDE